MSRKPVRISDVPYEKKRHKATDLLRFLVPVTSLCAFVDTRHGHFDSHASPISGRTGHKKPWIRAPWSPYTLDRHNKWFFCQYRRKPCVPLRTSPFDRQGRLVRFIRHTDEPGYISGCPFHKLSNPPYCVTSFVCRKLYVILIFSSSENRCNSLPIKPKVKQKHGDKQHNS